MTAVARLKTYYLQTYGCQMNAYDSEILAFLLERMHYTPVSDPAEADVAIFNTCCIREGADQRVYGRLGDFKRFKQDRPGQVLAVVGCLAQKDGRAFLERFPQVDLVVGTHNLKELPELLGRVRAGEGPLVRVDRRGHHMDLPAAPRSSFSAMVPISTGCNQWCTFCIVPYVRGQLCSRPLAQVVAEVRRLAASGRREILLLGQNVNDYGSDLSPRVDFADLLEAMKGIPGLDRLRFTSPHPYYFTDRVIEAMASNPAVCEHVHLPLQAGDDTVLRRMRRGYTAESFVALTERIRRALPEVSITTDIIVGFPGETEEQFQRTCDVVRRVRFDGAFMFAYSPRPGTPGALFRDPVPEEERMDRLHRLIELQNAISQENHRSRLGRVVEVLVEGPSKKDPARLTGRTRQHWLVHFAGPGDLTGRMARVRLEEAYVWGFVGSLEEAERPPTPDHRRS